VDPAVERRNRRWSPDHLERPEETGYRACLKLIELMEKPETPPFVEELPVELIVP